MVRPPAIPLLATLLLLLACGGGHGAPPVDAGPDGPPPPSCGPGDDACDDGDFCNGPEVCDAERGCVSAGSPCTADQVCDEVADECVACLGDADADGDGHARLACGGDDCDDADPNRFPGNPEVCDGAAHDEDCDLETPGDRDLDEDGFVDARCCNIALDGSGACGADCNDARPNVKPTSTEVCDRVDNDCDGRVDEGVGVAGFVDADGDLRGDPERPTVACAQTLGFAVLGDDCDDADPLRHPGFPELCDGTDNDCDDVIDEASRPVPQWVDADGDGYGDPGSETTLTCALTTGLSPLPFDCDDGTAARSPAAPELCNGVDDDCDGVADHVTPGGVPEDADGDGIPAAACGLAVVDCDDADPSAGPEGDELCDGFDNDCDGAVDEDAVSVTWYRDADGDGVGAAAPTVESCAPVPGHVRVTGDCDDADPARATTAAERCNGVDDDCDGRTDEAPAATACAAAGGVCEDGTCVDDGCASPYADCDGLPGCEVDTGVTPSACGDCLTACEVGQACDAGDCRGVDDATLGGFATCARLGGRAMCWGVRGGYGALGDRVLSGESVSPVNVVGLGTAVELTAGTVHFCARTTDRRILCWGQNAYGQLGTGEGTGDRAVPTPALVGESVALDSGSVHTCAVRSIGTVFCWGHDDDGQSGGSTRTIVWTPTQIAGLSGVADVAAGNDHTCARMGDGTVRCWGSNAMGQLAQGDTTARAGVVTALGLAGVTELEAGGGTTCAIDGAGDLYCWGENDEGQVGAGSTEVAITLPTRIASGVDQVDVSERHLCFRAAGVVRCAGGNQFGAVGDGTTGDRSSPVTVTLPFAADRISVGGESGSGHSCAIGGGGRVYCWGSNLAFELGRETDLSWDPSPGPVTF